MGFCFFNNAALAARFAQARRGLGRVLIVDWDLHHGNGTEAIFYDDPTVMYLSTHQHPNWPGTGAPTDVGTGAGVGYTANVRLPMGAGDRSYQQTFAEVFRPLVAAFAPELVIVSAGYDAHWRDPLGRMGLTVPGFADLTREVRAWADASAQGRLLLLMEGGYDLDALAQSLAGSLQALRGAAYPDALGPSPYPEPLRDVEVAIAATQAALAPHWPSLGW
jgi:acetoin utilization deacetylase AcuC-like enzyme